MDVILYIILFVFGAVIFIVGFTGKFGITLEMRTTVMFIGFIIFVILAGSAFNLETQFCDMPTFNQTVMTNVTV